MTQSTARNATCFAIDPFSVGILVGNEIGHASLRMLAKGAWLKVTNVAAAASGQTL